MKLAGFAQANEIALRQSYLRVAKRAAIMVGRYTHAHQFKRANRQIKLLRAWIQATMFANQYREIA